MHVEHTLRKRFGERVRALRQVTGLSQEAFADHAGFARSYMSRVERGKGNPSLDAIEVLAVALKVEVHELFVGSEPGMAARRPVRVPFAEDETYFHPGLRMKRSNRYHVGRNENERTFEDFEDALQYLKELDDEACWRRPNPAGNWGIVKVVRWDVLPDQG